MNIQHNAIFFFLLNFIEFSFETSAWRKKCQFRPFQLAEITYRCVLFIKIKSNRYWKSNSANRLQHQDILNKCGNWQFYIPTPLPNLQVCSICLTGMNNGAQFTTKNCIMMWHKRLYQSMKQVCT